MGNTLMAIGNFFRGLAALCLVLLIGAGGLVGYGAYKKHFQLEADLREREETITKLTADIAVKDEKIRELDLANRLLKVDHRMAEIRVLSQMKDADDQVTQTTLEFVEVDSDGKPIDTPRKFTIEGDVVYVDTWVAKFDDKLVETGNPLGATSICLFRRLFGEKQKPEDGFKLDRTGDQPIAYNHGKQISEREKDIWSKFWEYANNPKLAEQAKLRALHGDAPSKKVLEGKRYRIDLRASDGLTFGQPEDLPLNKPAT